VTVRATKIFRREVKKKGKRKKQERKQKRVKDNITSWPTASSDSRSPHRD